MDAKKENGPAIFYWNKDRIFDFQSPEKRKNENAATVEEEGVYMGSRIGWQCRRKFL